MAESGSKHTIIPVERCPHTFSCLNACSLPQTKFERIAYETPRVDPPTSGSLAVRVPGMEMHRAFANEAASDEQVDLVERVEDVERVGRERRCDEPVDGVEDCGRSAIPGGCQFRIRTPTLEFVAFGEPVDNQVPK